MRDYIDSFFALIGSFLLIYIALPILLLLTTQMLRFDDIVAVLRDEVVLNALSNSLLTSTATTVIALLFGIPLGYILARKDFRGKSVIQGIVDVPVVIPHSVVGIMLLFTFSYRILDSYIGIIMAMLFVSASFTVNSARDGFLAVDEKLEHVARTLGASKFRAFIHISLPMAMPSILSGAVMTWARAISEVGAILIVAYYPKTAQILVMEYFNSYGLESAQPLSVILILMSLGLFIFLRWAVRRNLNA